MKFGLFVCFIAFKSHGRNIFKISEISLNGVNHLSPFHFVILCLLWAEDVHMGGSEEEGWVGTNKGLAGHSTARRDTAEETKGYEINFGPFFPPSLSISCSFSRWLSTLKFG